MKCRVRVTEYYETSADAYVEIEAQNADEARDKADELYTEDSRAFDFIPDKHHYECTGVSFNFDNREED